MRCLEAPRPLTLSEIARESHLTPSKLRFYLVSFTKIGVVAQDSDSGRYSLGPSALRLGMSALNQLDILDAQSCKAMRELVEQTGKTAFVSVWGTHGPTVVDGQEGSSVSPLAVQIGSVVHILHSATGRTFLAYLPFSLTQELVAKEMAASKRDPSPSRRLSWTALNRLVADVKEQGISYCHHPTNVICALAAPIFDHMGNLKCVMTQLTRDNEGSMANYDVVEGGKQLLHVANSISQEMRTNQEQNKMLRL